jgi:hypothetical protein
MQELKPWLQGMQLCKWLMQESVECKKVEMGLNLKWLSFLSKVQISFIDGERMICYCHQNLEQS